jgi:SAM-dependent methyltransferase
MYLYILTIFLSAFLLFQIQPVAAKMILPWFGGSSSVWSASMVFFQTTLLGGYLYAHWLNKKLAPRRQALVHGLLLMASLVLLPIHANPAWRGASPDHPAVAVLLVLAASVGLPYFLLSTTGPLIQAWYARSFAGAMPYRLYALSNLASMLGLLTYPILVEPRWAMPTQRLIWSAGFALFAVVCAATAFSSARRATTPAATEQADEPAAAAPGWRDCALWILLAACASVLLLAVTRHLTENVAPVPFLWVLPLSVYLLSFILCFDAPRYYHRPTFLALLVPSLCAIAYWMDGGLKIPAMVALLNGALFVFCMVCHGELVRRRPAHAHLTLFYLMLSVGGALGGMFVGLLAPAVFIGMFEFPIGLGLCAVLGVTVVWKAANRYLRPALLVTAGAYCAWLAWDAQDGVTGYRAVVRNFYSQTRVSEHDDSDVGLIRVMFHGEIKHGEQYFGKQFQHQATAYYCQACGIGQALGTLPAASPRRIGIVGLGAGTLAVYGRAGDVLRIYEINSQVLDLARQQFTYLSNTPARVETVLGDGRLMLERDPDQHFDILIMDAFSGDSIPTHLITLEALRAYMRHLGPNGVLALHITNRYLDLRPVIAAAARELGLRAVAYDYQPPDDDLLCRHSDWAVLLRPGQSAPPHFTEIHATRSIRAWTDDYTTLLPILR